MGTMSHFAYRGKHIQLKDFRSLYKTENCKKIQDKCKKSCLLPRKIFVFDDGKDGGCDDDHDGGCEDTRFCAFLALQRMGEEHLMLQSQKVKV